MLALAATQIGEGLSLALIVVLTLFFLMVTAFVVVPHIAIALTIPTFALIPMLKVLAFPWIGPLKDMITLAAICAAAVLVVQRSSQGDAAEGRLLGRSGRGPVRDPLSRQRRRPEP